MLQRLSSLNKTNDIFKRQNSSFHTNDVLSPSQGDGSLNHSLVNKMRAEMDVMMEERENNLAEVMTKKKEIIEQVHSMKDAASEQVALKQRDNKAIRDEVHRDLQEALKKRQDEEAAELAKRMELIRQIRELEKIPI